MNQKIDPSEQVKFILEYLELNDFKTNLEIIANILMALGVANMDQNFLMELPIEDLVDSAIVMEKLIQYRKAHGESIASATALQGMNILTWLNKNNSGK